MSWRNYGEKFGTVHTRRGFVVGGEEGAILNDKYNMYIFLNFSFFSL